LGGCAGGRTSQQLSRAAWFSASEGFARPTYRVGGQSFRLVRGRSAAPFSSEQGRELAFIDSRRPTCYFLNWQRGKATGCIGYRQSLLRRCSVLWLALGVS